MQLSTKSSPLLLIITLFLLTVAVPAQPAPIQAERLTWLSVVPAGAVDPTDPTPFAPIGPQPCMIYRCGPAGMWTGIISWVTLYNIDEQNEDAQQELDTITTKYPWLLPPGESDLVALQGAISNGWLVDSPNELAAPFPVLAARILHAATGGDTVRQVTFAELLPAQPVAPYGTTFSDVQPIDLLQWLPPQDTESTRIKNAWWDSLYCATEGENQNDQQGNVFDAWLLGKELAALQTDPEDYQQFLNDTSIRSWETLNINGIGIMLRLQSFSIVQGNSSSPAASTPAGTPGVDVNSGPLVVTLSPVYNLPLTLIGTILSDGRPWTKVNHTGAFLNGLALSPFMAPSGITFPRLSGESPLSATLHAGGVAYTVVGTYDEKGRVFFSLGGITFPPGTSVVMRSLSNAVGALDLGTVTWTGFTVNPY
jgi:hypothetical protein